jgi:predicted XRE-type DNA-binding protein
MNKKRFANVWDAIEDTPAQAENMKLRSASIMALKDHIARTGRAKPIGSRQAAWRYPAAYL